MSRPLFERPILPVADEDDAAATARAALPYVRDAGGTVTILNVVEKAGGAPDKAGVEQREEHAEKMFAAAREVFEAAEIEVETEIAYGTDISETIFRVARERDATAVVFTPRGGNRFVRMLTGDTALDLVTDNDRPVVALPDPEKRADDAGPDDE